MKGENGHEIRQVALVLAGLVKVVGAYLPTFTKWARAKARAH